MRAIHERPPGTYGERRIHAELRELGEHVSRKRIARLMRAMGLARVSRRKFPTTTTRDRNARPDPDLVDRNFTAPGPDQLWVADITYIPTCAGFLYLADVLDAWSRRVVGWAMATHLRTELVLGAFNIAVTQWRPTNVIHHSDQGCQYTSLAFGRRCELMGVRPSMGSVGDAYDDAMCESFFATLDCEPLQRHRFTNQGKARMHVQSTSAPLGAGLSLSARVRAAEPQSSVGTKDVNPPRERGQLQSAHGTSNASTPPSPLRAPTVVHAGVQTPCAVGDERGVMHARFVAATLLRSSHGG